MKLKKNIKILLIIVGILLLLGTGTGIYLLVNNNEKTNVVDNNEKENKPNDEVTEPDELDPNNEQNSNNNDNEEISKEPDEKDNESDTKVIIEKHAANEKSGIYKESILNGALPELDDNMIPIYYEDNEWKKADINSEWYSYEKLNWANAVYVKNDKLSSYKSASAGTSINEDDVLGYFVWVPRYEYKLFNVDNGRTSEQIIEVNFVSNSTTKKTVEKNGKYYTHPAFTAEYSDKTYELNGFWIAKFEPSLNKDKVINILPGKHTLVNINFADMWSYAKSITKSYNASIESRMLTNMEWGAIAYLAQSKYGKINNNEYKGTDKQIFLNTVMGDKDGKNPSNDRVTTGCSSGSTASDETPNCPYNYDVPYYGTGASSTGTIYGIYDLAGGSWDCVMGIISTYPVKSGIGGYKGSVPSNKRYYTLYKVDSNMYNRTRGKLGDATREVLSNTYKYPNGESKGWYDDYAYFANANYPWIKRGGSYNDKTSSGIFSYGITLGTARGDKSFRVVLSKH